MTYEYDSWNRMLSMTYADGEEVHYGYNKSGQLDQMQSEKGSNNQSFIDSIRYDKFGAKTAIYYGNQTHTHYFYEPIMRRLTQLKTYDMNNELLQDLSYSYDVINNISSISNSANEVNGLGGSYDYTYDYDSLNRLINAAGSFDNGTNYPFSLAMSYSASGNITNKTLSASKLLDGNSLTESYNRDYSYYANRPHAMSGITEGGSQTKAFEWDPNGNMVAMHTINGKQTTTRTLCWDEENRLAAVKDQFNLSNYIYDAGGERVWKLTGQVEQLSLNGGMLIDMATLTNKTLYTSPYMVITDQEYTKHYYAGSERIASKLGGGFELASVNPTDDNHDLAPITSYTSIPEFYDQKKAGLMELLSRSWDCVNMQGYASIEGEQLLSIEELQNSNNPENEMFFYHTDHLGSSSWITDASGEAYQHMQNLPFGEQFINQRQSSWGAVYQFTGYEKDQETGFDYAHARYYCSELSIFLSVDPMDYKYPSTSGYMYVGGNPIMITDPTGMDWIKDKDGNYVHDKNVTKDTKLGEGEKYLGKSKEIKVNDSEGNYSYSYNLNEDGSFSDTRGNEYEAGSGEFDPRFKSGHKINSKLSTNENLPNNTGSYSAWSGVVGQIAASECKLYKHPGFGIQAVAKYGTRVGWYGEALTIGVDVINVYNNPTWGNWGRLGVSVGIASSNTIPYAGPSISFGLSVLNSGGTFNSFYNGLDSQQILFNKTGLLIFISPVTGSPMLINIKK
jgi:RHS repeat-associated protein